MACLGCQQKARALTARSGRQAPRTQGRRYMGIKRKVVDQPDPQKADIVPRPEEGKRDPSTGQLISVIKNGVDSYSQLDSIEPTATVLGDMSSEKKEGDYK